MYMRNYLSIMMEVSSIFLTLSGTKENFEKKEELWNYAKKSDAKEFIIGTENSIVQHLQFACPDKQFYPLSRDCVCHNMKLTTLGDVYQCVKGTGGEEIKLDEEVRIKAKRCIDTMLELGN